MDGVAGLVIFDFVDAPMGQGERALMSHGTGQASRAMEWNWSMTD
jgi:hypothetical protein